MGRNIAEALAGTGVAVGLVSVVGRDEAGNGLLAHAKAANIDISKVVILDTNSGRHKEDSGSAIAVHNKANDSPPSSIASKNPSTACYTAIHDSKGELLGAVADVEILSELSPEIIHSLAGSIRNSRLVVADGNLSPKTFVKLMKLCGTYKIPVFFEPTSDHKCTLPISTGMIGYVSILILNLILLLSITI